MIKLRKVVNKDGIRSYAEVAYNIGDEVWISPADGLFIKCKILEIDDEARQRDPFGYLFYDVDEPVGHDLANDELYPSLDSAVVSDGNLREIRDVVSLEEWRAGRVKFIRGTHGEDAAPLEEWATYFPNKVRGVDWFTISDLVIE